MAPFPAHQTKHLPLLAYELPSGQIVNVKQDDSLVDSTGRTVWLGAQVLAVYLHDLLGGSEKAYKSAAGGRKRRKRVIDLGSGTGLLALSLNAQGYDVVATDMEVIAKGILRENVEGRPPPRTELEQPVLEARTLDWFAEPVQWDLSRWSITPRSPSATAEPPSNAPLLSPPFDLITTSDSIYDPTLTQPLLRTLHALCTPTRAPPPIFLALEVRDPTLIAGFLHSAREDWAFKCSRVDERRLEKLMGEGGLGWEREDWEGVQVWKLMLGTRGRGRVDGG